MGVRADYARATRDERDVVHAGVFIPAESADITPRLLDTPETAAVGWADVQMTFPGSGHGATMTTGRRSGTLSVIVPVLNEEDNIPELVRRLTTALDGGLPFDVIFVDDGSIDRTPQLLRALHAEDPRLKSLHLLRTIDHQASIYAG